MDRKRRRLVQAMAVGSAATWVAGCGGGSSSDSPPPPSAAPNQPETPETPAPSEPRVPRVDFSHGVASGDPLANRVMLWTRVTPREETSGPIPAVSYTHLTLPTIYSV